jgi:hypothetical protein
MNELASQAVSFDSEYLSSWFLYIVAVFGCSTVLWRMLIAFGLREAAMVISGLLAIALLVPSRVDEGLLYWSPALMAALLEWLSYGSDVALQRFQPVGLALAAYLFLYLLYRVVIIQKSPAKNPANQ